MCDRRRKRRTLNNDDLFTFEIEQELFIMEDQSQSDFYDGTLILTLYNIDYMLYWISYNLFQTKKKYTKDSLSKTVRFSTSPMTALFQTKQLEILKLIIKLKPIYFILTIL